MVYLLVIEARCTLEPENRNTERKKMELQNDQDFSLEDNVIKGFERPANLISYNIGEVLLDAFDKNPNHVSQIDAVTNGQTTHAEMKDRSVRLALWMEKQGLSPDDVVSVFTHIHLDAYIPVFATYLAQAVLNIWKCQIHTYPIDQVRDWLEMFAPKLIFACPYAADVLEEALSRAKLSAIIVVMGEHPRHQSIYDIMRSQSSTDVEKYLPPNRKSPQEAAVVVISSGTTSFPKGFMISAETLLRNAYDYKFDLSHKNVWWYGSPLGVASVSMTIACVIRNATRILANDRPIDSRELCRMIEKFQVSYAHVTPKMLDSLMSFDEIEEYNLASLKVMRSGGAKLNRATFDKLRSSCLRGKIYQGYGTTEIGSGRVMPIIGNQQSNNSIGYVASNIQLKIIDRDTGKTLGANALGEISIKTPTKMLGYYKDPELTRKAIDAKGWYHTGDVGYYNVSGEIFLMGRLTDAFEYRRQEFFSSEIEDILWAHPAITELAVVSVLHGSVGKVPVAFAVLRPGENVTEHEIAGLLKNERKYETLPLTVQFLKAMPLTPVSKISKVHLKELALSIINEH